MSAYVLLKLLMSWGKEIKCGGCRSTCRCLSTVLNATEKSKIQGLFKALE